MKLKHREMHRKEINKKLYEQISNRFSADCFLFFISVLLLEFGLLACFFLKNAPIALGVISFIFGILFMTLYRSLFLGIQKRSNYQDWLTPTDQLIISSLLLLSLLMGTQGLGFFYGTLIVPSFYVRFKVKEYSEPYLNVYFFRIARVYIRDVAMYKLSNNKYR